MNLPPPHKMSILIIDDYDEMRRSIRAMLQHAKLGKYFFEASNGKDAWEFLERSKEPIHLIISDLHMPGLTGTELLARVRESKRYRDTPFLMVSAEAKKEVVADAAENEVDAYITKPIPTEALAEKIRDLIERANNPNPMTSHLVNARDLEEKGEMNAAIKEVRNAINLNPQISRPHRELGRLYLQQNEQEKSLDCFQTAASLNRLDVTAFNYLGQIYYQMGEIDKAIESFSKAMEINPRHSDRIIKFARLLLKKDKLKEAESILNPMVLDNDENLDLKEDIVELCLEYNLNDLAIVSCEKVLKADPERYYLNKKIGLALCNSGKTSEANRVWEMALEKFSDDIELQLMFAKTCLDLEMINKAKKWVTRVVGLDPENKEARELLESCKEESEGAA